MLAVGLLTRRGKTVQVLPLSSVVPETDAQQLPKQARTWRRLRAVVKAASRSPFGSPHSTGEAVPAESSEPSDVAQPDARSTTKGSCSSRSTTRGNSCGSILSMSRCTTNCSNSSLSPTTRSLSPTTRSSQTFSLPIERQGSAFSAFSDWSSSTVVECSFTVDTLSTAQRSYAVDSSFTSLETDVSLTGQPFEALPDPVSVPGEVGMLLHDRKEKFRRKLLVVHGPLDCTRKFRGSVVRVSA
mmetsp:Transcript_160319/g.514432  ORF Transcript_160319/g.514432 Transcript_160319/m.514432 type:complete len:242 (-) Transcript_160319:219-944(-)